MRDRFFSEEFLRRLENIALVTRRSIAGQTQGERRGPKKGHSVEFSDFRSYVPGDDFRRIDWNAYGRLGRLFIKLFVEEEDLTVHLLIDTSRSMNWGEPNKLNYAVRIAGALGYIALVGLDRVTVSTVGGHPSLPGKGYFPPHRGKNHALTLFNFLQDLADTLPQITIPQADPYPNLLAFLNNGHHSTSSRPGSLILISDLEHDGWLDGITALATRGFEISVIHVLSPDEVNPPFEGDVKLIDSEDSSEVEITADYDLLARYKQDLIHWQENLRRFFSVRGILYIPLQTSLPIEELLFAWLEKHGVLR